MSATKLTTLEARVLGVLVEKELTVPDIYPLSLNALTSGCNQKNNRDPVLHATEAEVQAAVDRLKPLMLVIESSGSRVMRYSENVARVLRVSSEAVALLAALWLRGPQTAAELRAATERLHRFADASSVEGFLNQLAARAEEVGGPLVELQPRAPGAREQRWADLLTPRVDRAPARSPDAADVEDATNWRAEIEELRAVVQELRERIERLEDRGNV
ncbi:MAG TPA: DUF480 domain-containing protein [Burkholderiaceae bacterium]|nr:DUF480 domain-containing protein [Burkholderiaceae bacterium]